MKMDSLRLGTFQASPGGGHSILFRLQAQIFLQADHSHGAQIHT